MSNKSPKGANRISGRDIVRRVSSFLLKTPKPEAETLNIDAEGIINTEKASRVLHMPVMLKNRLKSPKFFEHFLVIGYNNSAHDSSTPQSDGVILYKYPPNSELVVGNIASFCFPCGVSSSGNPTADFLAKQAENEEDDPMGNIKTYHYKNQQNSFLFLQTNAKKEIFYGVCVIDSNLKTFPGFIECDDKTQYSEKKAFVFITQQPAFSLFFDVIYQILLQTEQSSLCSSTDIKEQIPTILSSFYSAALPKPGSQFRVPLLPTVGGFVRPLHSDDEYYLADYSIPILFHVFKKRQILWLLSAILLERKILFICKNVRMLSSVVLSFVPLLRPFEYQSVVVPVLPERMDMVIEAPVPFLIGLPRGPNASSLNVPKDVILVNVDEKKITVTGGLSSVPELPRQATISNLLTTYIRGLKQYTTTDVPYTTTADLSKVAQGISHSFFGFFSDYFKDFKKYCLTDISEGITVFLRDSFLAVLPEREKKFFKLFMDTQIWHEYKGTKVEHIDRMQQYSPRRKLSDPTNSL